MVKHIYTKAMCFCQRQLSSIESSYYDNAAYCAALNHTYGDAYSSINHLDKTQTFGRGSGPGQGSFFLPEDILDVPGLNLSAADFD